MYGQNPKNKSNQDEVLLALADLSEAVGKGFDKFGREFSGLNDWFEQVDRQLHWKSGCQLDSIETIIPRDQARRLEALERRVGAPK